MREIPLTRGLFAKVDDSDYETLLEYKWMAIKGYSTYYARTSVRREDGSVQSILMHRLILQVSDPKIDCDHIDKDGLNNTRANIRACTRSENLRNRGKQANNTSGFKGVSYHKKDKKWVAKIKIHGKQIRIGSFKYPDLAYGAYRIVAHDLHGEFSRSE